MVYFIVFFIWFIRCLSLPALAPITSVYSMAQVIMNSRSTLRLSLTLSFADCSAAIHIWSLITSVPYFLQVRLCGPNLIFLNINLTYPTTLIGWFKSLCSLFVVSCFVLSSLNRLPVALAFARLVWLCLSCPSSLPSGGFALLLAGARSLSPKAPLPP